MPAKEEVDVVPSTRCCFSMKDPATTPHDRATTRTLRRGACRRRRAATSTTSAGHWKMERTEKSST